MRNRRLRQTLKVNERHPTPSIGGSKVKMLQTLRALLWLSYVWLVPCAEAADVQADPWVSVQKGEPTLQLYFFWSKTCPHCLQARPFVAQLAEQRDWVRLHDLELTENPGNARLYVELAASLGQEARSVPAFLFCGQMITGFDSADGVGAMLVKQLEICRADVHTAGKPAVTADDGVALPQLPRLGDADLETWSLPAVAIVLGALDSFNPCAFFVLLFLLSLLVNARSRTRMLVVGGLFVLVSGAAYFVFMAAWLNLFLVIGHLYWVTLAAGALALLIGLLNVKDYFWFRTGPSLSVPDSAKPGLFRRMRGLVGAERMATVLAGTLALAIVANAYELLCTAGFPMVFTRLLTLNPLPAAAYYGYLALYCAVYILPLLAIVGLFVLTLGRRKLSEREGRILKLVSGLMMTALGMLLLVQPQALGRLEITVLLISAVLLGSWLIVKLSGKEKPVEFEG